MTPAKACTHEATMLDKESLSTGSTQSAWFVSSWRANTELYGLVMTSSSSEGKTTVEKRYTFGKWSSNKVRRYVPSPDPVPPPNECIREKDCRESHNSVALRTACNR